jgi:choice-of-anchor A domain-containing protein
MPRLRPFLFGAAFAVTLAVSAAAQGPAIQLDAPCYCAIGENYCVTATGPAGWNIYLLGTPTPGTLETPIGTLGLGPDLILWATGAFDAAGDATLCIAPIPCFAPLIGFDCYFQLAAFSPDYSAGGLSNVDPSSIVAPFGPATEFNVFVLGNATLFNSDVGGKLAVGGNLSLQNYGVGTGLGNSNGAEDRLVVGGNLTFVNGQVYGGNLVYGGTASLTGVGVPNGTISQGSPFDFACAAEVLLRRADDLAARTPNGVTATQFGGIQMTGSDPRQNLFAVSAATVASSTWWTITAPAGSDVIVNVSGTSASIQNMGISYTGPAANRVVFNFPQATTLTIAGVAVNAAVLAPRAALTFNNGQVNGNLWVASWIGTGEPHEVPYAGCPETY